MAPMESGGGDGATLARNIAAFRNHFLNARALSSKPAPVQATSLFGRKYSSPFGISAVGFAGNIRRGADEMLAAAAREANVPFILSGVSTASIEEIVKIAPGCACQQLYPASDANITQDIVRRAQDAGVEVLVLTVDTPALLHNDWLMRRGLRLPVHVPARQWPYVLAQAFMHPRWSWEQARGGGLPVPRGFAQYVEPPRTTKRVTQAMVSCQNWGDLERVRLLWPGALVVKGMMDDRDATQALDMGRMRLRSRTTAETSSTACRRHWTYYRTWRPAYVAARRFYSTAASDGEQIFWLPEHSVRLFVLSVARRCTGRRRTAPRGVASDSYRSV